MGNNGSTSSTMISTTGQTKVDVKSIKSSMVLGKRENSSSRSNPTTNKVALEKNEESKAPDTQSILKKKGGKRAPRDPHLTIETRIAQAQASVNVTEAAKQKGKHTNPTTTSSAEMITPNLVEMANRVSVPLNERPSRRLRPKAPSSSPTPSSLASSCDSVASDEVVREPVSLRTFEILKVLGRGSHGKVFLVRHRGTKQLYAMKQLKKKDVINAKQLENTKREFRVHAMLARQEAQCPNITPLRFAFHSRSRLYMVFDFCAGGELYFHIGQRGRLPEPLAKFFGAQIVLAIGYLHSNGIAYRDLKPENLLLDAEGNIQLVDLGLCKDGMRSATEGSSTFCGTTEYLAPEILNYQEHGLAVDWWSYGMVLYEMLTGLPPWYSYQQEEVIAGILNGELQFPEYVSDSARDLITKLLSRDPSTRLGSAEDVEELIAHPFFESIDWVALAKNEVVQPFTPPPNKDDIVCNFDCEFTSSVIEAERDHVPASSNDPFGRFYFDFEDPINC